MIRINKALAPPGFMAGALLAITPFVDYWIGPGLSDYFRFLLIFVSAAAAYMAYRTLRWECHWPAWIFIAILILFNPVARIGIMGSLIGAVVCWVSAAVMLAAPFVVKEPEDGQAGSRRP